MTGASGASDADLVAGVLAGDRDAFAQVYDKYADRLHDFAFSMLRQREDAMDAVAFFRERQNARFGEGGGGGFRCC